MKKAKKYRQYQHKKAVLNNLRRGFIELAEVKKGNIQTTSAEEFLNEL